MTRIVTWSRGMVANPILAYATVIAIQMRVIWDVWRYKDLVSGDTSSYFLDAVSWAHGIHDDIIWSPLYTDAWGSVYALFHGNVYASEMAFRVAIIVVVAVLVLAIMRSLMSPPFALLIGVWWTLVPANYNVLYEVHLFGLIPILIAALIVARRQTRGAVGVSLAILAGTTLLLRNELLVTTIIVAIVIAWCERRGHWPRADRHTVYLRAYGLPLVLVLAIGGILYSRSFDQGHSAFQSFSAKQDLNACQAYAFNYQQRHPDKFTGNAFTECQPLMRQVFGRAEPSFLSAAISDPRAMAAFVAWNGRLMGSGLQVALFNATSTRDQPDYPLVETQRNYALILSLFVLALLVAGSVAVRRDWQYWRNHWLPAHQWIAIILGAECVTTIAVALSERPRPEYMYSLTVCLMALTGICAEALVRRATVRRFVAPTAVLAMVLLLTLTPHFYHPSPRPLRAAVRRLEAVAPRLQRPGSVLIAAGYNFELCGYLAATHLRHCTSPSWPTLQIELARGIPIDRVLNQAGATVIYVEPSLLGDPSIAKLVAAPQAAGWQRFSGGTGAEGPWQVLIRTS